MTTEDYESFVNSFNNIASLHQDAMRKRGFWNEEQNYAVCIAMMHAELSAVLGAITLGLDPTVRLADCVLKIMDFASSRSYDVAKSLAEEVASARGSKE